MPKFEVTYAVIKSQTYIVTMSAKDEEDAEEKLQERLDALDPNTTKYPGKLEEGEADVEFTIEDVTEL